MAAPWPDALPENRPAEALQLEIGSKVDFYSSSKQRWIPCTVLSVDAATKAVRLDVKPTRVLDVQQQRHRLRLHVRSPEAEAQLRRMRAAHGQGRGLREEAYAIFNRFAEPGPNGAGAREGVRLRLNSVEDLGEELDAHLGVDGSAECLRRHLSQARGNGLSAEDFCEVFHELLWGTPQADALEAGAGHAARGSDLATILIGAAEDAATDANGAAQQGLMQQVRGMAARAWEAVFADRPRESAGGDPAEEDLQQLEDMGFADRERCAEVLRRHGGRLSPLVFEELLSGGGVDAAGASASGEAPQALAHKAAPSLVAVGDREGRGH